MSNTEHRFIANFYYQLSHKSTLVIKLANTLHWQTKDQKIEIALVQCWKDHRAWRTRDDSDGNDDITGNQICGSYPRKKLQHLLQAVLSRSWVPRVNQKCGRQPKEWYSRDQPAFVSHMEIAKVSWATVRIPIGALSD